MNMKYAILIVGSVAAFGLLFYGVSLTQRSPDWTGFYYKDVKGRTEPLSIILKTPDVRSQQGAFKTIEACQDWAEYVRLKDGGASLDREDLFYCARNCRVVKGAGADCGDSQASVYLMGK